MHPQHSTCTHCGTPFFNKKHPNQIYCSRRCSQEAHTLMPRACEVCQAAFAPRRQRQRTCSITCGQVARCKKMYLVTWQDRLWSRVNKTDSCWIWTARTNDDGYGVLTVKHKPQYAHRLSWELAHGPIPDGLFVCHDCPGGDNPRCVNPAHLFLGTNRDNILDARTKGTLATGDRHGSLTHPERLHRGKRVP